MNPAKESRLMENEVRFGGQTKQPFNGVHRFFLLIISICFFLYHDMESILATDLFWQIKAVQDWIERGLSLQIDNYSFTYAGETVANPRLFFGLLAHIFYKYARGIEGIHLLRVAIWTVPTALFLIAMAKIKTSRLSEFVGWLFFISAITYRRELRPEMVSFTFFMLYALILIKYFEKRNLGYLWTIAVLQVLWVNTHTSAMIGYIVLFGFYFDELIFYLKSKNKKAALEISFLGFITIVSGYLNHSFIHPVVFVLKGGNKDWAKYYLENGANPVWDWSPFIQLYCLCIAAILVVWVFQKRWGAVISLVILFWQSVSMTKMFLHLITATLIPFLYTLQSFETYPKWLQNIDFRKPIFKIFTFIFITTLFYSIYSNRTFFYPLGKKLHLSFPSEITQYFKGEGYRGKIMNDDYTGGFISFALGPESKVYIDGRVNMLYPLEFVLRYGQVTSDTKAFQDENRKYEFDFVIANTDILDTLFDNAMKAGGFFIDFASASHALLKRGSGKFMNSTYPFSFASCFSESDKEKYENELIQARALLPKNSTLLTFLEFVNDYNKSPDKVAYLMQDHPEILMSRQTMRLAAELSLKHKLDKEALAYYTKMAEVTFRDRINMAKILCTLDGCRQSEELLSQPMKYKPSLIEKAILYQTLTEIRKISPLRVYSNSWKTEAERQFLEARIDISKEVPFPNYCKTPSVSN